MDEDLSALAGASIVFDLDGTLVDSAPDLGRVLNLLLAREGLPALPLADIRPMVGRGARCLLERGFRAAGESAPDGRLEALVSEFLELYAADIARLSAPFPGVRAAVARLRAAGARLGVCTNKKEGLSRQLLEALDLLSSFDAVLGADSVPARKPDPGHVLAVVAALGGAPGRAVMVGDSAADVNAAKAAEVPVIAVAYGYTDIPARDLGADAVVEHFGEVVPRIAALLAGRGPSGA